MENYGVKDVILIKRRNAAKNPLLTIWSTMFTAQPRMRARIHFVGNSQLVQVHAMHTQKLSLSLDFLAILQIIIIAINKAAL